MRDQLGKPIPSPVVLGQLSEKFRETVKALAEQQGVPVYQFRHKAVPFRRKTSTPLPHCRCSKTTPGKNYPQNLMLDPRQGFLCDSDPNAWYRTSFGREPDYSEILNNIAKSPAERMQVLRGYFEPTEEERQEGRKMPTSAHRAIAELVAKGYVRVTITTNFDRLLESALADVGIQITRESRMAIPKPSPFGTLDAHRQSALDFHSQHALAARFLERRRG
jgi:hypothetical protein